MTQDLILDSRSEEAVNFARLLYIGHAVTLVFSLGMLTVLLVIINYVKRPETSGTIAYSHHSWMIRSFWWWAIWSAIGWLFIFTFVGVIVGLPIVAVAWIWYAYRLIRGFMDLENKKAMSA